ncbi:hypothetical protein B0H63DRAFT_81260 [Podospora didyma]|uniref:Fungal N-terminal domain-containing protein n=1 Tax=Podospora didyma TaxID=330526 RepID=A0AAE0K2D7_9PEZI|nr:hypothetical protein B0H63DRAFT_81260 [Podospora didyma]
MNPLSICNRLSRHLWCHSQDNDIYHQLYLYLKDARQDLTAVALRLTELQIVLDLLRGASDGVDNVMPESLVSQVKSIVGNCRLILVCIDALLEKHRSSMSRSTRWTISGKDQVAALEQQLSAHVSALNIALEVSLLGISKAVKRTVGNVQSTTALIHGQTKAIHSDTSNIKDDTACILDEISRLRLHLPAGATADNGSPNPMIERYLNSVTIYAATLRRRFTGAMTRAGTPVVPTTHLTSPPTSLGGAPAPVTPVVRLGEEAAAQYKAGERAQKAGTKHLTILHELEGHRVSLLPNHNICLVINEGKVSFCEVPSGQLIKDFLCLDLRLSDASRMPFFSPDGS